MFRNTFNDLLNGIASTSVRTNNNEEVELDALKREIRARFDDIRHDYDQEVRHLHRNFANVSISELSVHS